MILGKAFQICPTPVKIGGLFRSDDFGSDGLPGLDVVDYQHQLSQIPGGEAAVPIWIYRYIYISTFRKVELYVAVLKSSPV